MAGYLYPNELIEYILWQPVVFSYSFLISGADLFILAMIGYITKKLLKAVPFLTITAVSFFAVLLLGPLADLHQPQRAYLIYSNPRLISTPSNPGFSFISLHAIIWLVTIILGIIFLLLFYAYPMRLRAESASRLRPLYRAFSLGVKTKEDYEKLRAPTVAVSCVLLAISTLWGVYPATLFVSQTWLIAWREWSLLPIIFYTDTFVASTAAGIFVYYLMKGRKMEPEVIDPLLKIHTAASISVAGLLGLQILLWNNRLETSLQGLSILLPLIYVVMILMALSFLLSLASLKMRVLSLLVSIVALVGVATNKWNVIVNGQLINRSGEVLSLQLPAGWQLLAASPLLAAIAIFVLLSFIFPLEVKEVG
jgi:predicted membrane protein